MATTQVGDKVIIQLNAKQCAYGRVTAASTEGKKFKVLLEKEELKGNETPLEVKLNEIVANLGKNPKPGSVFGVKVEPLYEVIEADLSKFWGETRVYQNMNPDQLKQLRKNLFAVEKELKAQRLPVLPLELEVRNASGSNLGMYKYHPKGDVDTVIVRPTVDVDFTYIMSHEYAHGIWYRHMTPKMHMSWVRMYHEAMVLKSIPKGELKGILDELVTEGDLTSYAKSVDEETVIILKAIIRHIKQVHSIDRHHINLMLHIGEDISDLWPSEIELGEKQTIVSTYAKKSPEELFAESFSLRFSGKKLPQKVGDLLTKTLSHLTR